MLNLSNTRFGAPIAAIAMLAASPLAASEPADLPPPSRSTAEDLAAGMADAQTQVLDLEEERNRRFTIPVMVGDAGPFDFMIDTGSQATALTHQINHSLALAPGGRAMLVGMAGRRPVDLVKVGKLSFGSHTVSDIVSPLLDRRHVGADGILGLDTLQDLRVLINFREETIAVQNVADLRNARRGFEIVVRAREELGQLLITNALVEGVRTTVIIDTGAQASIANNALRERIRAKRAEEVTTIDVLGASLVGEMSIMRSLKLGEIELRGVPLTFADAPAFASLGLQDVPTISLGMQHLRMFDRIAIDFADRRVLFDVPREVARAVRRSKRGGRAFGF